MNSWYQLLLWNIASGKYLNLSRRTDYHDWMALWVLPQEEQARADAR